MIVSHECILWAYARLCGILVMFRCCFCYVSFDPMWDYAGFGYASLLFRWIWLCILWPYVRLCGIWLCLVVVSLDLVMPRCCFVGFGYASLLFRCFGYVSLSLLFRLCSYSWLCIVYYINDTILYKGYCLWFDLVLLIHDPCRRPVMLYIQRKFFK